ncbi:MAG: polyprenol monophosphomannose synthase [Chloroflexi bacterium]|nr:polyprenol monophosphomannose synthase [Chloroflexota bacterium]MCI0578725.1 polyprenol monophosphomannose synthase [Chloroflexota bacterium]MCI0643990.1 polyprenol monophosphomannose synthase [Chloroflexota bacterium]MCI0732011.1 polyprenol monophosphomannose synthase [Chloroflexota bacterium]
MQRIVVVVPTYNEADNLPVLVAELWALQIPGLSVLVVDDNSPDGTGRIADELSAQRPGQLYALHHPGKGGLGRAYVAGFKWALAYGADAVIQMDCDFSHSPDYIPEMLEKLRESDVVVGSRYVSGGKLDERWGTGRYLLSWWANSIYTRLILNLRVKDATAGFKCWRANALRGINLDMLTSNGYSFQFEMAYVTEKLGYKISEIPIYFEDRRIGHSKLTIPIKIEAALRAWEILWRYRKFTPAMRQPDAAVGHQDA